MKRGINQYSYLQSLQPPAYWWLLNYPRTRIRLLFFAFLSVANLFAVSTYSQGKLSVSNFDIALKTDEPIHYNNFTKSERYVYLYQSGSLSHLRFDNEQQRFDTFRIDHSRLELLAHELRRPRAGRANMDWVRNIRQGQSSLQIYDLSADRDTLTCFAGIYAADSADFSDAGGRLTNRIYLLKMVGGKLIRMDECSSLDSAVLRDSEGKYGLSFEGIVHRPDYYVVPVFTQNVDGRSNMYMRITKSAPYRFLGWENIRLPQKSIDEQSGYNYLRAYYDRNYIVYDYSDKLYQVSSKRLIDLAKIMDIPDDSKVTEFATDQRQIHDISDLGDGKVALLVRHGSNSRRMIVQIDGAEAVLIGSKMIATEFPSKTTGFFMILMGESVLTIKKEDRTFRVLST